MGREGVAPSRMEGIHLDISAWGFLWQSADKACYTAWTAILRGVAFSTLGRVNRSTPSFSCASIFA